VDVPRLRVELELQLPAIATATATATQNPSHVCNLHHGSWQHWIFKPLNRARDQTCILMDTSGIRFPCASTGTPYFYCSMVLLRNNITGNYIQSFVIEDNMRKRMCVCVCNWVTMLYSRNRQNIVNQLL